MIKKTFSGWEVILQGGSKGGNSTQEVRSSKGKTGVNYDNTGGKRNRRTPLQVKGVT